MPASAANSPLRRAALAVAGLLALGFGFLALDRLFTGGLPAPLDFTAFWTAGRIAVEGGNAYDSVAVLAIQRDLGLNDTAIMMWNPPWALTLVLPLGLLPFRTAHGVWVLLHLGLMIACAELLWRGLGGSKANRGIAYLITLGFAPTLLLIFCGQLTTFVLIGLAGYLVLRPRHPCFAGAIGALTAIKPHMMVLFALWLLIDAIRDRAGRKVLLGGAVTLILASIAPTLLNADIWSQYAAITTGSSSTEHRHVSDWAPPLVGWWLRMAVPGQPFWVQWLPLACGMAFLLVWCVKTRQTPEIPALVGYSLLIAPYGVWTHDLVMLLVPILAAAAKLAQNPSRRAVLFGSLTLLLANALIFVMIVQKTPYEWFVWVVPTVLIGCAATLRLAEPQSNPAPIPLGA